MNSVANRASGVSYPLASIFGSGFLIIVPVLERTIGPYAAFGAAGICAVAYFVGSAIRHIASDVEPRLASGDLDRTTAAVEKLSDFLIVIAYVRHRSSGIL